MHGLLRTIPRKFSPLFTLHLKSQTWLKTEEVVRWAELQEGTGEEEESEKIRGSVWLASCFDVGGTKRGSGGWEGGVDRGTVVTHCCRSAPWLGTSRGRISGHNCPDKRSTTVGLVFTLQSNRLLYHPVQCAIVVFTYLFITRSKKFIYKIFSLRILNF